MYGLFLFFSFLFFSFLFFSFLLKADVLEESYHDGTLLSNCGVNEGVTLTLLHVTVLLRLSTALQASASRRCVGIVAF